MGVSVIAPARQHDSTAAWQRGWTALAVCLGLSSSARVASAQQPPPPTPWDLPAAPVVCASGAVPRCVCNGGAVGSRWCVGERGSLGPCPCPTTSPLAPGAVEAPANGETATRASDGARPERYWYGWQSLLVDGASLALFIPGALTKQDPVWLSALLVFSLGGPIVHWAHGNIGRGFGSLGIRVITAPLLMLFGVHMGDGHILSTLIASALYAVPAAIDAALLAYDAPTSTTPGRLVWAPTLDLRAGGATVGVAGSF